MVFLPGETLANIFSLFQAQLPADEWNLYGAELDREPYETLTSLCLVSRQFHRIAQPFLYHTVILKEHYDDEDQLNHFARTLVDKPSLGALVRAAALEAGVFEPSQAERLKDALGERLDLPESFRERFVGEMDDIHVYRKQDGLSAALLLFMPNLRLFEQKLHSDSELLTHMLSGRVDLDGPLEPSISTADGEKDPGAMVEYANFGLPHLTEVRLRTEDFQDGTTPIGDVEEVFLHPHLKTLRLLGFGWLTAERRDLRYGEYQNHTLEYLELKECLVDSGSLQDIFKRFKNLRRLKIELGDPRRTLGRDDDDDWHVDFDQFGDLLRKQGTNLIEFDLQTVEFGRPDSFIGSLRQLGSLQHLSLAQEDFVNRWYDLRDDHPPPMPLADALPPSIETIFFYNQLNWRRKDTDDDRWEEMYDLITSGKFPKLRRIEVEMTYDSPASKSKRLEKSLDGWKVYLDERHMWERFASTGCTRTIVTFSKLER